MAHTFRIYCSTSEDHSLAIVNGEVVLAKADLRDDRQAWLKDLSYGGGIKDAAGSPAFALVNRSTGEALKHSSGFCHPVRVIKFDPLHVDDKILWAEGEDTGDGYRRIHKFNNMEHVFHHEPADLRRNMNCYAFDHDLVDRRRAVARDGSRLILSLWNGSRNQLWRMVQLQSAAAPEAAEHARRFRILCQSGEGLSVTVRDGAVVLATADHQDERQYVQCWVQSFQNTGHVTDEEGHRAFALVNRATGKALMHKGHGDDELVQLAGHSPDTVDVALLWTQSDDLGEGFHGIRAVNDVGVVLDAAKGVPDYGGAHDGTPIIVFPWNDGPNQKWKLLPFY